MTYLKETIAKIFNKETKLPYLYIVAREDANLSPMFSFIPVLVYLSTDEHNISLVEGNFSV